MRTPRLRRQPVRTLRAHLTRCRVACHAVCHGDGTQAIARARRVLAAVLLSATVVLTGPVAPLADIAHAAHSARATTLRDVQPRSADSAAETPGPRDVGGERQAAGEGATPRRRGTTGQRDAPGPHRQDLVGRQFDARVVRVADGDTLEVIPAAESRPVRLRLQGIDAPELGEVFSREATALLRTLTREGRVQVDVRDMDRYGRLVSRVTAAGQDASAALVRAGLACHAYVRDDRLAREESQARAGGSGFWAATTSKPGCVARTAFSASTNNRGTAAPPPAAARTSPPRPGTTTAAATFHANTSSGVYHAATCPNARCRNCTRSFSTENEARAAGFRPAADCLK